MGKKQVRGSKRKRKASWIQICRTMRNKKRTQLLAQKKCVKNEANEVDISEHEPMSAGVLERATATDNMELKCNADDVSQATLVNGLENDMPYHVMGPGCIPKQECQPDGETYASIEQPCELEPSSVVTAHLEEMASSSSGEALMNYHCRRSRRNERLPASYKSTRAYGQRQESRDTKPNTKDKSTKIVKNKNKRIKAKQSQVKKTSNKATQTKVKSVEERNEPYPALNLNLQFPSLITHSRPAREDANGLIVYGRRIVDFRYFFNELCAIVNHSERLGCTKGYLKIVKEKIDGFVSDYVISCEMCGSDFSLSTCKPEEADANADAIAASEALGNDYCQLNRFAAGIQLPMISHSTYNRHLQTSRVRPEDAAEVEVPIGPTEMNASRTEVKDKNDTSKVKQSANKLDKMDDGSSLQACFEPAIDQTSPRPSTSVSAPPSDSLELELALASIKEELNCEEEALALNTRVKLEEDVSYLGGGGVRES